jgi:hypothetical protein
LLLVGCGESAQRAGRTTALAGGARVAAAEARHTIHAQCTM